MVPMAAQVENGIVVNVLSGDVEFLTAAFGGYWVDATGTDAAPEFLWYGEKFINPYAEEQP